MSERQAGIMEIIYKNKTEGRWRGGHLGAQSHRDIGGLHTYSRVPGLGKQRGKREDTVSMRRGGGGGGADRGTVTGNIMTEEKKEGRPAEFPVEPSVTHHIDTRASGSNHSARTEKDQQRETETTLHKLCCF